VTGAVHTTPQEPQLLLSLFGLDSQPSDTWPLQSTQPVSHMAIVHAPMLHPGVAWGTEQGAPQAPQFCGSVPVAVSQPFAGLPSQSENPGVHLTAHSSAPPSGDTQVAIAFMPDGAQGVQVDGPQP
jgi:hypothetical protein